MEMNDICKQAGIGIHDAEGMDRLTLLMEHFLVEQKKQGELLYIISSFCEKAEARGLLDR